MRRVLPDLRPRSRLALMAALLTVPAACAPAPPDASVLMDADRAFAAAVAEGGTDAWVRWFAEDGAMIQPGTGEIRGHDAIREAMAGLDQPGVSLTWEPLRADMAASGDLGWTTGMWESRPTPEAEPARGRYVSIWRKQADGEWRVVMDLGNPVED